DPRNDLAGTVRGHDGQLHLDEHALDRRLRYGRSEGGGCLAAVDDLEVRRAHEAQSTGGRRDNRLGGRRRDAVVVGKEHPGLLQERFPDALVDLSLGREERTNVPLKQSAAVFVVEIAENLAWHDAQEGP